MRIMFLGNQEAGIAALEEIVLTRKHQVLVVSPPSHELRPYQVDISQWAEDHQLEVATPEDINGDAFLKLATDFAPDITLSVFYNQVLGNRLLSLPRVASINVHPSLLPAYRGSGALLWALMDGQDKVGITIHFMERVVDSGDMILQRELEVRPDETGHQVYGRIAELIRQVFREEFLDYLASGKFPRQPLGELTDAYTEFTPRRNNIDWNQTSAQINHVVRSLTSPLDGAYTIYEGEPLWIWKLTVVDQIELPSHRPSVFFLDESKTRLFVATGSGGGSIDSLSYAGAKQSPPEFISRFWVEADRPVASITLSTDRPDIVYRYWQPGDDDQLWPMIDSVGWLSESRYASKFNDAGLLDDSIIVAESGDEIIGHCLTTVRRLIHGDARLKIANVGQVLVKEEARGLGIGAGLFAQSLSFAARKGISAIWLVAHPDQGPAYEMYLRRGFEVVQGRSATILKARPPGRDLSVRPAQPTEMGIVSHLRRIFANTTSGVEDRNNDVSDGTEWHIIRDAGVPVATAAVRIVDGLSTFASLLYDTNTNPVDYLNAVATSLRLASVQLHGSPHSHLVRVTPSFQWEERSGDNLFYVVSLRRLLRQLAPFLRIRGHSLGLKSARLTIYTRDESATIQFASGEISGARPLPGDSELRFDRGGLGPALFGTLDLHQEVAEGRVKFEAGNLDLETALAWLAPFEHCDFTQLAAW